MLIEAIVKTAALLNCTDCQASHTSLGSLLVSYRPLATGHVSMSNYTREGIICSGELRPGGGRGVLREAREARDSPARGAYYSSCVVGAAVGLRSEVGTPVGLSSVVVGTAVGLHSVVGTAVGLASIVGTAVGARPEVGTPVGLSSVVGTAVVGTAVVGTAVGVLRS